MERPGDLMTIKAFAAAAGRSQQAIYKQINTRLASYVHEKGGQKYIERRALDEVFKSEDIQSIQPENAPNSSESFNVEQRLYAAMQATIDLLQEQLRVKDQQIETKDRQIAAQQEQLTQLTAALDHTTTSLQAAQALHAGTMQQLGAAEQENQVNAVEPVPEGKRGPEITEEHRKWRWPWQR